MRNAKAECTEWGMRRAQGTYAATYYHRLGDKRKAVMSKFPSKTALVGDTYVNRSCHLSGSWAQ
ncbi:MAG: hypothetical protein BWX80_01668 [Candidatus Hydrogenedentes bacterium ADurb.Bin101]|jgi:hypothetical protein|nr:MAG: hypothetical protein BWX80_01668 [Candidatus Hydrogenedentes bacterium ADurb.Bin101]